VSLNVLSNPQDIQPLVNLVVSVITFLGAVFVSVLVIAAQRKRRRRLKAFVSEADKLQREPAKISQAQAEQLSFDRSGSSASTSAAEQVPERGLPESSSQTQLEAHEAESSARSFPDGSAEERSWSDSSIGDRHDAAYEKPPAPIASTPRDGAPPLEKETASDVTEEASRSAGSAELPESPKAVDTIATAAATTATTAPSGPGLDAQVGSTPEESQERTSAWVSASRRIVLGLRRTRERLLSRLKAAFLSSKKVDQICESLEEALIEADVGVETSVKLIEAVRAQVKGVADPQSVRQVLRGEMLKVLRSVERAPQSVERSPFVALLVGVNGVGKTTTVAKLAAYFKAQGKTVIVGAGDTFRAAAIDQLEVWCSRVGVPLIKHQQGADPAAVAFDTVKAAAARKVDVALIDTAGRLQTKTNLMEELKKVVRVIGREIQGAPHEIWLVLDATTGQNALSQAKLFSQAVPVSGVILAKLDSSAKGGVAFAVAERLGLPIRFVGLGEGLEDLQPFDPEEFVDGLLEEETAEVEATVSALSA